MSYLLNEIQEIIWDLGRKASIDKNLLILSNQPYPDGTRYLEIHSDEYHLVSSERGFEFSRDVTVDLNELLYWFFSDKIFSISNKYELTHRIKAQDPRRLLFTKEIELMRLINPLWEEKKRKAINEILEKAPFNDSIW